PQRRRRGRLIFRVAFSVPGASQTSRTVVCAEPISGSRDFLRGGGLKRAMRTWRGYRNLEPGDRKLAVETAAALLTTRVGLRLVGLQRWRERIVRQTRFQDAGVAPASSVEVGRKVAAIQEAVSRHLPWQPTCLEKSLVLWRQLGRRGI